MHRKMQNWVKTNFKTSSCNTAPALLLNSPDLSRVPATFLKIRKSTTRSTEDTEGMVPTSRKLQSNSKKVSWIVIKGKTWLVWMSGEVNKSSNWRFKRHSLDPRFPFHFCYCEVLYVFNLSAAWKQSIEAKRKPATAGAHVCGGPYCGEQQFAGVAAERLRTLTQHQVCICNLCPWLFWLLHGSHKALPSKQPLIKYYAKCLLPGQSSIRELESTKREVLHRVILTCLLVW